MKFCRPSNAVQCQRARRIDFSSLLFRTHWFRAAEYIVRILRCVSLHSISIFNCLGSTTEDEPNRSRARTPFFFFSKMRFVCYFPKTFFFMNFVKSIKCFDSFGQISWIQLHSQLKIILWKNPFVFVFVFFFVLSKLFATKIYTKYQKMSVLTYN